jgi:hypothetical protein
MLAGCQAPSKPPADGAGGNRSSCTPPTCVTVTASPLPAATPRSGPAGRPDPCQLLTSQDVAQVFAKPAPSAEALDAAGIRTCTYHLDDGQVAVQLSVWPTDDTDWKSDYDRNVGPKSGSSAPQFGDAYMSNGDFFDMVGVRRGNVKLHLVVGPAGVVTVPQQQALMTAILAHWDRLT